MDRIERIRRVVALVDSLGHRCCVVGGVAVTIRVWDRSTKDIDLAVAVADDAEAEAIAHAFQGVGYSLFQVLEQTDRGVLSTLRFVVPGGSSPSLDLLFASCGIEREIVGAAERMTLPPGVAVPVARLPHLIAMKVLSESELRATDRTDLHMMIAAASTQELVEADAAVRLIAARGFDRGKDLASVLAAFVARRGRKLSQ